MSTTAQLSIMSAFTLQHLRVVGSECSKALVTCLISLRITVKMCQSLAQDAVEDLVFSCTRGHGAVRTKMRSRGNVVEVKKRKLTEHYKQANVANSDSRTSDDLSSPNLMKRLPTALV